MPNPWPGLLRTMLPSLPFLRCLFVSLGFSLLPLWTYWLHLNPQQSTVICHCAKEVCQEYLHCFSFKALNFLADIWVLEILKTQNNLSLLLFHAQGPLKFWINDLTLKCGPALSTVPPWLWSQLVLLQALSTSNTSAFLQFQLVHCTFLVADINCNLFACLFMPPTSESIVVHPEKP